MVGNRSKPCQGAKHDPLTCSHMTIPSAERWVECKQLSHQCTALWCAEPTDANEPPTPPAYVTCRNTRSSSTDADVQNTACVCVDQALFLPKPHGNTLHTRGYDSTASDQGEPSPRTLRDTFYLKGRDTRSRYVIPPQRPTQPSVIGTNNYTPYLHKGRRVPASLRTHSTPFLR